MELTRRWEFYGTVNASSTTNLLHAQAFTLAALAGAAAVEYYDHRFNPEAKVDKFTSQYIARADKD